MVDIRMIFNAFRILPNIVSIAMCGLTFAFLSPFFEVNKAFVHIINKAALICSLLTDFTEIFLGAYYQYEFLEHVLPVSVCRTFCSLYLLFLALTASKSVCFHRGRWICRILLMLVAGNWLYCSYLVVNSRNPDWILLTFFFADFMVLFYISAWIFCYYHALFATDVVYTAWSMELADLIGLTATLWQYKKENPWDDIAWAYFIFMCIFVFEITCSWCYFDNPRHMSIFVIVLDLTTDFPLLVLTLSQRTYKGSWIITLSLIWHSIVFIRGVLWIPLKLIRPYSDLTDLEDSESVSTGEIYDLRKILRVHEHDYYSLKSGIETQSWLLKSTEKQLESISMKEKKKRRDLKHMEREFSSLVKEIEETKKSLNILSSQALENLQKRTELKSGHETLSEQVRTMRTQLLLRQRKLAILSAQINSMLSKRDCETMEME